MSSPSAIPPIPTDTIFAARAAYSSDNFYLVVGDYLATLLGGASQNGFHATERTSRRERPSLEMVTIFQFIEKLSDPQAVEATRTRPDWKYALHLSMNYPGLPAKTLCEYRQWVLQGPIRQGRIQLIFDRLAESGLLTENQDQPVQVNAALDEVCFVTRLDWIFRAMQLAVGALATHQPEWLRKVALPHWYERYHQLRATPNLPQTKEERESLARSYGADANSLLEALRRSPPQGTSLAEILDLEVVLNRQFEIHNGDLSWRSAGCADCQA